MPGLRPEVMAEPLAATAVGAMGKSALDRALALAEARDAVVLGPGLGQEAETREFVREFVARCPRPLVVDADGLNALGAIGDSAATPRARASRGPDPAPGRDGSPHEHHGGRRAEPTLGVRPGPGAPDGSRRGAQGTAHAGGGALGRVAVNPTGNPGMATAGTGDVLAGLVGALLVLGTTPGARRWPRCSFTGGPATWRRPGWGQSSVLAGDLIDELPAAILSLAGGGGAPSARG